MATPIPVDARAYLERLVGQTIPTITGKPNTIVAVRGDDVFVRTQDTANREVGEPVPIQWVQDAVNTLYATGRIGINTTEATHRSAFIGAVLSTLPGTVGLRRPARVELVSREHEASALPELEAGLAYTWDELAAVFGFKPAFFSVAGGMVPSTATASLLLITHPGGAKSFDYQDHWDGADLIYTGAASSAINGVTTPAISRWPRTAGRYSCSRRPVPGEWCFSAAPSTSRNGLDARRTRGA